MGNSNSNDEPKEEIDIDTTNVGLWNISESGVSTIGVGEVLTIVVLVMAIIIKYCCKRMKVARRNELEETIRSANTGIYRSSAMHVSTPPAAQPQAIPMVTFKTSGQRQVQFSSQPALPVPSYWETCK